MVPLERAYYFKLVALIVDIAYKVIWKYIKENIAEPNNFKSFLNVRKVKNQLVHVYETSPCCECKSEKVTGNRLISRKQLLVLYESNETKRIQDHKEYNGGKLVQICICNYSAKNVDVNVVDVSLANYIIQKCGKHELGLDSWMEEIKDVRNEIFHLSDIQELTYDNFSRKWTKLEGSITGIARLIDSEYAAEIEKRIIQTKKLTTIGDYMLKYEILLRDYWKNKCAEFERAQMQEIEKKAAALRYNMPEIFSRLQETECNRTMTKIRKHVKLRSKPECNFIVTFIQRQ